MKAEHRKELQTNALADFLGRLMQKRETAGDASFPWFKVGLIAVVCFGAFLFYWVSSNRYKANAEAWAKLDYGTGNAIRDIETDYKDAKQGQAARLLVGYAVLWEQIKFLGSGQPGRVEQARTFMETKLIPHFEELAKECKDDPLFLAEAKYHLYVCKETLAVVDFKNLDAAKADLEELTKGDLAATPYGQLAKKRLEQYENLIELAGIMRFYTQFRERGGP